MKKTLLLLFLCVSIAGLGCKKKEEEPAPPVSEGAVQNVQDISRMEAQYKDAIAKDPKNFDAVVALGNIYYDAGQAEKAIDIYQKALEINPSDVNVMTDMGTMYLKVGNYDKAIETFRKSLSIDPKHEQSLYNLGVTLFQYKKDMKGALEAWEELLRINPNLPNAEGLKQMMNQARNAEKPESKSPSSGWAK